LHHTLFSVGFTTIMFGIRFSVHTTLEKGAYLSNA
jgi:hypothetical protein